MAELTVPELAQDPFREHYRQLVLGSLLQAAEARSVEERQSGHRRRAARAERDAARIRTAAGAAAPEPAAPARLFGRGLRSSIRMVWLTTLGLLALDLVVFGIHSWTTSVADLGLIVLTLVWFWVSAEDLLTSQKPRPGQLEPFS
jgi:hypothetical protein